jgi:hypothetical protein
MSEQLTKGIDYYMDNGLMVFTSAYHLKRGYCCGNNCKHCPWKNVKENDIFKNKNFPHTK